MHPKQRSLVEIAKALDREIERAGGIATYWIAIQERKRAQGRPHYTRLIDPVTGEIVAEVPESSSRAE